MLSDEAKARYIKSPNHCPYCGSGNIEDGQIHWDEPVTQDMDCHNCHKTWLDVLTITDIVEEDL